jgi:hypothetical protein
MAKMNVTYSREVLADGCFLGVTIEPYPDTDPTGKLEESLVINTADEDIARFSDLIDLENLAVGPDLLWFQADSYAGVPVGGDTLVFETIPGSWVKLGHTAPKSFTISTVTGPTYALEVSTPFPCGFTGTVTFKILVGAGPSERSASASTRVTVRRYDQNTPGNDAYVRVASAAKLFPSITEATNKYAALRSEAASLIDASDVEESFFTGDVTEEYD